MIRGGGGGYFIRVLYSHNTQRAAIAAAAAKAKARTKSRRRAFTAVYRGTPPGSSIECGSSVAFSSEHA